METGIANAVIQAASRGYGYETPVTSEEMRHQLEWSWGLEYGSVDEHLQLHLQNFGATHFADVLTDDNFIVVPDPKIARKIYLVASKMPRTLSEAPYMAHDLYQYDDSMFEYLALPVDPSSAIGPQILTSSIPPHLTISLSVDKIFRRGGYVQARFDAMYKSLTRLAKVFLPPGARMMPTSRTFDNLQYIHERWAICYVPPLFLGLPEEKPSVQAWSATSSASESEWYVLEVKTPSDIDEPSRRLGRRELEQPPVVKIPQLATADDEDDSMSSHSHITGVEDPEEFAKGSVARGDYEKDQIWLTRMESWAKGAERVDDETLVNDAQIEVDSKEAPRVASSMDLDKPDYLSKPKLLSKRKVRT